MTTGRHLAPLIRETIRIALLEDLGQGDVTSLRVIAGDRSAKAAIRAKEDFILAGMPFVTEVFSVLDPDVSVVTDPAEGVSVVKGDIVAEVSGRAWSLLAGERTALNILQRVSGVATLTRSFVNRVSGLPARIADTRKTTPCMRYMEKYGVVVGGGINHRFGLSDGILIKDNHLKIAGSITRAVEAARKELPFRKVEVEVKDLDELREALAAGADIIMLDNMSVEQMAEASGIAGGKAVLEASGNVNLSNVRAIAETGVHVISVGALTHSARAVDISMKIL